MKQSLVSSNLQTLLYKFQHCSCSVTITSTNLVQIWHFSYLGNFAFGNAGCPENTREQKQKDELISVFIGLPGIQYKARDGGHGFTRLLA